MAFQERRLDGQNVDGILVGPGEIVVVDDGVRLMSIVSSGLLVCLWHHGGPEAAMTHFLYPAIYEPSKATARYGNVALPRAIAMLRECCGDPLAVLEAQIFGGAERFDSEPRNQQNLEMARKILMASSVAVVSEDVGGRKGRKVMFDAHTGHAVVIKVHALRESDWEIG